MPVEIDNGIRVKILILYAQGKSQPNIIQQTGVSATSITRIINKAKSRGWDPTSLDPAKSQPKIKYVTNNLRSGRPPVISKERGDQAILVLVRNSTTRQYSVDELAQKILTRFKWKVSARTIRRFLYHIGYRSVKLTTKPGLNNKQKLKRISRCLGLLDWPVEKWKKIAWSDETSVILGSVRGKRRCWRLPGEENNPKYTQQRWKGRKEFIF